jgi:8-oxo-dGTP diphosphatase
VEPRRVAVVVLVDPRGWILLQERDASAPIAANKWGFVGGHVEPGEDFEAAAYRELGEETGVRWEFGLARWFHGEFLHAEQRGPTHVQIWVAPTVLRDHDIVLGEGRQIVFVDPASLEQLDLGEMARWFLPRLMESDLYRTLVTAAASMAARGLAVRRP